MHRSHGTDHGKPVDQTGDEGVMRRTCIRAVTGMDMIRVGKVDDQWQEQCRWHQVREGRDVQVMEPGPAHQVGQQVRRDGWLQMTE